MNKTKKLIPESELPAFRAFMQKSENDKELKELRWKVGNYEAYKLFRKKNLNSWM